MAHRHQRCESPGQFRDVLSARLQSHRSGAWNRRGQDGGDSRFVPRSGGALPIVVAVSETGKPAEPPLEITTACGVVRPSPGDFSFIAKVL